MAPTTSSTTPSRYKSQRRPLQAVDDTSSSDGPSSPSIDDNIARAKSRYRRKPDASTSPPSTEPAIPASMPQQAVGPSRYRSKHQHSPLQPIYQEQIVQAPVTRQRTNLVSQRTEPREHKNLGGDEAGSRTEAAAVPRRADSGRHGEEDPKIFGQAHSSPISTPPVAVTIGHLFPPPKPASPPPKKDGPPQSSIIRATKSTPDLTAADFADEPGCFGGLFRRKKAESALDDPESNLNARSRTAKGAQSAGGPRNIAGPDAPVSAINAGDRHVLLLCGRSKALFPVTPTTTSTDLIKSAAICLSERIEVKSAIILEDFSTVGVQRPLRRYECIREVMNSWENDRQNSLLLVDPGTGTVEPELTLAGVPKTEPEEKTWSLLYSQKAGKWDTRYITLRSTGQLLCHKDMEKLKDVTMICHLSDFDIYTPTPERLKKKIKPPKKFCFAVKSQQKTSLFESTQDFVHFFSCADRLEADSFYAGVQSWRSWYLVNMKGEGQRGKEKAAPVSTSVPGRDRSTSNDLSNAQSAKPRPDSHYQLGSFRPFSINLDQFQPDVDTSRPDHGSSGTFTKSSNQFDVNVSPERRTSSAKRFHPPISLKAKPQLAENEPLANLNRQGSVHRRKPSSEQRRPEKSEFKDAGLLGRTYSQRRKEHEEKETQRSQPFTAGPSLLNGGASERENSSSSGALQRNTSLRQSSGGNGHVRRSSSIREDSRNGGHARSNSGDLDRSGTKRQKPKPLIDLTPQYQEPPQHSKKGRGYHPDHIDQNGLITNATTPEDPLGLQHQTIFRKTSGQPVGHISPGLAGKSVSDSQQSRQTSASRPARSPLQDAFTGEGLLGAAHNRTGWGGADKGRGVIDGSRANGRPLVDLSGESSFAQGSLLQHVERAEGGPVPPPVIDREKRLERDVRYGEGI